MISFGHTFLVRKPKHATSAPHHHILSNTYIIEMSYPATGAHTEEDDSTNPILIPTFPIDLIVIYRNWRYPIVIEQPLSQIQRNSVVRIVRAGIPCFMGISGIVGRHIGVVDRFSILKISTTKPGIEAVIVPTLWVDMEDQ